jgi:hypothetical protein
VQRQRVRITEMFGSNSPSHPERARDRRVRLAHPDSQIQLSNSNSKTRRNQRQPLIIPVADHVVKWDRITLSNQIHDTNDAPSGTISALVRTAPTPTSVSDTRAEVRNSNRQKLRTQPLLPTQPAVQTTKLNRSASHERPKTSHPSFEHGDPEPRPGNGPCRNRTYNLAIKSRLLCQLS